MFWDGQLAGGPAPASLLAAWPAGWPAGQLANHAAATSWRGARQEKKACFFLRPGVRQGARSPSKSPRKLVL